MNNWRSPLARLRVRFGIVVLLAVIPGFVLAYIAAANERRIARDNAEEQVRAVTTSMVEHEVALIQEAHNLLLAFGDIPAGVFASPECSPVVASIVAEPNLYQRMAIARSSGEVVCSAPALEHLDTTAEWFRRALTDGRSVAFLYDGSDDIRMVTAVTAGTGDERLVLLAEILVSQFASQRLQAGLPAYMSLAVIDADDRVVYRANTGMNVGDIISDVDVVEALRASDGPGTITGHGSDGVQRIYGYAPLAHPEGAGLFAGIPTRVALRDANRLFRFRLVALGIATLIALAVASSVAYFAIIRRLRGLVTMARRIGTGDLTARSNVRTMDEIGELGAALDAMAEDLRHRDEERARLLTAVVEASQDERRRIAHDVHDDPIQVMSAHVMRLQLLRRQVDDPELKAQIQELEESGRAATARLRDLVFELHSPILETRGLEAAIEALLDRTFDGLGVEYSVTSKLDADPPDATRDTAYRIVQETIRNARRHADATKVSVELRRDGDDLVVRVVDNGRGFVPDAVEERPGHLGVRAIKERAQAVGGGVAVQSAPGRGTTVVCRLPWSLDGS